MARVVTNTCTFRSHQAPQAAGYADVTLHSSVGREPRFTGLTAQAHRAHVCCSKPHTASTPISESFLGVLLPYLAAFLKKKWGKKYVL